MSVKVERGEGFVHIEVLCEGTDNCTADDCPLDEFPDMEVSMDCGSCRYLSAEKDDCHFEIVFFCKHCPARHDC